MTCVRSILNRLLWASLTSLLVFSLILLPAFSARVAAAAEPPASAPDFELPDLNGSSVSLSNFKGQKPLLLYFWATWCPYCISVRPEVIKLRNKVPQTDLGVLAVNVGGSDTLERLKRYEEANPAPFTVLYDANGKTARSFKIFGIPHFVLIDRDGVIKFSGNNLPSDPMALLKQ